mmetsp:Transcript_36128/g.116337  ORF Transcript_36128/g.116337 Transcript_36128/m.116337 type:complete len:226 (-) Transcript_36128:58-735(-)
MLLVLFFLSSCASSRWAGDVSCRLPPRPGGPLFLPLVPSVSPTWSLSPAPLAVCSPLCSSSSSPRCRRFPPALAASSLLSPRFLRRPSPSSSQWVVLSVVPIALVVLPLPASRRLSASSLSFSSASRCRCRLRRQQIHAFAAHSISRILSFLSFCPSFRRSVSAATRSFLSASCTTCMTRVVRSTWTAPSSPRSTLWHASVGGRTSSVSPPFGRAKSTSSTPAST